MPSPAFGEVGQLMPVPPFQMVGATIVSRKALVPIVMLFV
jgi:hypothetical protein